MQTTINRNLLKYAVQRAITCPRCQQILDMRRVVLLTLTGVDKLIPQRDYTLCCKCWDEVRLAMYDLAAGIPGGNLEVLDAREVFARTPRTQAIVMCMCGARATFTSKRAANKAGWYLRNPNADPAHEEAMYDRCPQCGLNDGARAKEAK